VATAERVRLVWTGDLEDDCVCIIGPYLAHCEYLDKLENGCHYWHASVSKVDERRMVVGADLFHSGESAGFITHGEKARDICESILHAVLSRELCRTSVRLLNFLAHGKVVSREEIRETKGLECKWSALNTAIYRLERNRYLRRVRCGEYQRILS